MIDVANIAEVAVNYNETTFPYFPPDDESEYSIHMHQTLKTVEEWVNLTGFYGTCWYNIPDGLTVEPFGSNDGQNKVKKNCTFELPFISLLKNLAGPAISKQLSINYKYVKKRYV